MASATWNLALMAPNAIDSLHLVLASCASFHGIGECLNVAGGHAFMYSFIHPLAHVASLLGAALQLQMGLTYDGMPRLMVLRYGHWTVATPMIVYLISRLSDFTLLRTMGVMFAQAVVIITGFLALVLPLQYECRLRSLELT